MTDILSSLIPVLRLKLGDTNPLTYRYLDAWLVTSLEASLSLLARYWGSKYLLTSTGVVYRNTAYIDFTEVSPPIIQFKDEWIIILAASIIVKSGTLENLSWSISSWRDSELQFSNLQSGKEKSTSLDRDIDELSKFLRSPIRRPVAAVRNSWTDQF